jgi:hypothetical protein
LENAEIGRLIFAAVCQQRSRPVVSVQQRHSNAAGISNLHIAQSDTDQSGRREHSGENYQPPNPCMHLLPLKTGAAEKEEQKTLQV